MKKIKFYKIDNFLDSKTFTKFEKELNNIKFDSELVMGGRQRIANNEKNFNEYLKLHSSFKKVYQSFNSKIFFDNTLSKFKNNSIIKNLENNYHFDENFSVTNPKCYENLIIDESLTGNSNKSKSLINLLFTKVKKYFKKKITLYLYLDLSKATKNYRREIHCDNRDRVIVILLFLNNFSPNNGGIFQFFNQEDGKYKLCKKIIPKKNQCIMFLADKNAYHNVSKILSSDNRYFMYGAITADKIMREELSSD